MDNSREQFDELLGGKEELPAAVSTLKFINARSQEISALTEAIEEPQNKHLAFQKMPRHLRRRAMSHNIKRMPRRLREIHLSQMEKSGLPIKGKRPSRKYRRRPNNLLQEYNRRQRKAIWLETHIWHAKRFHMVQKWGYKLPHSPTNKAFRACYRATTKHCLIQDVSYLNCIELKGTEDIILEHLSQLTNPQCGLTFAAKSYISGKKEGGVMVYRKGMYPFHAIGRVSFMWQPETVANMRTLWIWCHPAFYSELLQELISLFQFKLIEHTEMDVDPIEVDAEGNEAKVDLVKAPVKVKKYVEKSKLETKNVGRLPKYTNNKVEMVLLKDTLNRFRLTGPLAQVVLTEALKFVNINKFLKFEEQAMEIASEEKPRSEWLLEFYGQKNCFSSLNQQKYFWNDVLPNINSANELPPKMILAVTVMDPRLSMPTTRIKAVYSSDAPIQPTVPECLSQNSPLWDESIRNAVTHSKLATSQLNTLRSRALVPGLATPEWLGRCYVSHLPLLIVQNPGDYGSGWDIILPAGWGVPVWLGLVFRGARAGGLRETTRLNLEACRGPTLPPDTDAGIHLSKQHLMESTEKHFRLPPDKRPNYIKLGVLSPFQCPWEVLLQNWHPGKSDKRFFVIRNLSQLDFLQCLLKKMKPVVRCTFSDNDRACGLVQVGVEMCGRGTFGECSMICAAVKKDLKLMKDKSGRGPVEPLHEDVNEEQRKSLRDAHLAKLKRLRKMRVKAKRKLEENGIFLAKLDKKPKKLPTEELVKKQAELMRELWLPHEVTNIKNSSSRCVLGFLTYGDYSFTQSKSVGYGFVAVSALLSVLEGNQRNFLVRKITSSQYYFAKIKLFYPS